MSLDGRGYKEEVGLPLSGGESTMHADEAGSCREHLHDMVHVAKPAYWEKVGMA